MIPNLSRQRVKEIILDHHGAAFWYSNFKNHSKVSFSKFKKALLTELDSNCDQNDDQSEIEQVKRDIYPDYQNEARQKEKEIKRQNRIFDISLPHLLSKLYFISLENSFWVFLVGHSHSSNYAKWA